MTKTSIFLAVLIVLSVAVVGVTKTRTIAPEYNPPEQENYFTDSHKMFRFVVPETFSVIEGDADYTQPWRQGDTLPGAVLAVMKSPRGLYPKTNFSEVVFTVGRSADPQAVASCLSQAVGPFVETSNVVWGGVPYTRIVFMDAGAGNYYETTSYRTIHKDVCYALEYTIHSTNIYNYSPDQGITEYHKQEVVGLMEDVVKSFQFIGESAQ